MDLEQWRTQKTWEESLEQLKAMIPGLYPQWTDYNLHDPGITLMELAAWLGQIQMYQLRQIGREHRRGFLKLLGIRPVKPKPGMAYVTVDAGGALFLPAGTRFYAAHIPFETRQSQMVTEGIFKCFVMLEGDERQVLEGEWLREGRGVSVLPFGHNPQIGNILEIHLTQPLEPGVNHRLYLEFSGFDGRQPVPVDEEKYDGHGYYPLADIRMEYLGRDGWREAAGPAERTSGEPAGGTAQKGPVPCRPYDDTFGFVQDGSIMFSLDTDMEEEDPCVRFRLERTDYIAAPCITRISLAMVKVWQQETVKAEELPVFNGTGFPDQCYDLGEEWMDEDEFRLKAECPVHGGMEEVCWQQAEDFCCSEPEDRHFMLEDGMLCFGSGMRGMMPEGVIRAEHMVRTLGDQGNIKSGTINRIESFSGLPEDTKVVNEMDVTGGTGRETEEEALARFRREQEADWETPSGRAVTFRDYERLVKQAPGLMIEDCRAYSQRPEDKEIILVVKPWAERKKAVLSRGYEKNIYRFLEEKRMIGTKLRVVSPDYYDVTIVCMVYARVQYRMAAQMVEEAVREWIEGRKFGQGIPYGQLMGMIDSLPCVQQISSLWLDSAGRGKRTPRGDLLLPPGGLLCLKKVTCNLMRPMRERL